LISCTHGKIIKLVCPNGTLWKFRPQPQTESLNFPKLLQPCSIPVGVIGIFHDIILLATLWPWGQLSL